METEPLKRKENVECLCRQPYKHTPSNSIELTCLCVDTMQTDSTCLRQRVPTLSAMGAAPIRRPHSSTASSKHRNENEKCRGGESALPSSPTESFHRRQTGKVSLKSSWKIVGWRGPENENDQNR